MKNKLTMGGVIGFLGDSLISLKALYVIKHIYRAEIVFLEKVI